MKLTRATRPIYLCAAGACAAFIVLQVDRTGVAQFLYEWLAFFGPALLFAFAYAGCVFDGEAGKRRRVWVIVLNGLSFVAMLIAFRRLPIRDQWPGAYYDSPIFLITAFPIFAASAIYLLLKKRSGLAPVAAVLEWAFVLAVSASLFASWTPIDHPMSGLGDVLCSLSPILFAFAAGSLPQRRALAHSVVLLAAAILVPRMYSAEFTHYRLESNAWIAFNRPYLNQPYELAGLTASITILTVALIVLAVAFAIWRLLPQRWAMGESRVCEWTWPGVVAMLLFLGVWFRLSVLPYRIPGNIDRAAVPFFQILHIAKHGLQFDEMCVSVYHEQHILYVSEDHRRLFRYTFNKMGALTLDLPDPLMRRVIQMAHSESVAKPPGRRVMVPLRAWNAEGWYVYAEDAGFGSYSTEEGTAPPPRELVTLSRDLEFVPGKSEAPVDIRHMSRILL